jgi:hypothetical protein
MSRSTRILSVVAPVPEPGSCAVCYAQYCKLGDAAKAHANSLPASPQHKETSGDLYTARCKIHREKWDEGLFNNLTNADWNEHLAWVGRVLGAPYPEDHRGGDNGWHMIRREIALLDGEKWLILAMQRGMGAISDAPALHRRYIGKLFQFYDEMKQRRLRTI